MSQAKTQSSYYNVKDIFKIIVTAARKSQRHIKLSRQHRLQRFLACVSARNGRSNALQIGQEINRNELKK